MGLGWAGAGKGGDAIPGQHRHLVAHDTHVAPTSATRTPRCSVMFFVGMLLQAIFDTGVVCSGKRSDEGSPHVMVMVFGISYRFVLRLVGVDAVRGRGRAMYHYDVKSCHRRVECLKTFFSVQRILMSGDGVGASFRCVHDCCEWRRLSWRRSKKEEMRMFFVCMWRMNGVFLD